MNTGGPAFPYSALQPGGPTMYADSEGMTLRQYAAIKLKVPDSGTDWLDDMIKKSVRDGFAAKAMQAVIANAMCSEKEAVFYDEVSAISYEMADAMMKAREK